MLYDDADNPYEQSSLPYEVYVDPADTAFPQQQKLVPRNSPSRDPMVLPRLSKEETQAFIADCKRWLVAGSLVAFAILSTLVAGHMAETAASQLAPASNGSLTSPSDPANGGFFRHHRDGDNFGEHNFGQPPSSGSHSS